MSASRIFIEVSSLHDLHFSGIPRTTAQICSHGLDREDVAFFVGSSIVPREVVKEIIDEESGWPLMRAGLERSGWPSLIRVISQSNSPTVGLFPNLPGLDLFDRTVQVIHDLVPLLEPQFTAPGVREDYFTAYFADYRGGDRVVCVSEATKLSVIENLPIPAELLRVIPNSPRVPKEGSPILPVGPYVLVLGTVEPRKNIETVLRLLSRKPGLTSRFEFVFVGRDGWHMTFEGAMASVGLDPGFSGVTRLNHVSEGLKWTLIRNASALLLPSHFEGYGLSAAEATTVGTTVIASDSSSIPEAAGSFAYLFDPREEAELNRILDQLADQDSNEMPASALVAQRSFAEQVLELCSGVEL